VRKTINLGLKLMSADIQRHSIAFEDVHWQLRMSTDIHWLWWHVYGFMVTSPDTQHEPSFYVVWRNWQNWILSEMTQSSRLSRVTRNEKCEANTEGNSAVCIVVSHVQLPESMVRFIDSFQSFQWVTVIPHPMLMGKSFLFVSMQ